jgi:hypothetical protein
MGDYYFAMQSGWSLGTVTYMLRRPFREVATRFHLRHPWYIPVKLMGELRAFCMGLSRWFRGPRLPAVLHDERCSATDEAQRAAEAHFPIDADEPKCLKQ